MSNRNFSLFLTLTSLVGAFGLGSAANANSAIQMRPASACAREIMGEVVTSRGVERDPLVSQGPPSDAESMVTKINSKHLEDSGLNLADYSRTKLTYQKFVEGRNPILFSLMHELAYDAVLAKEGISFRADSGNGSTLVDRRNLKQARVVHRQTLKAYADKIEKMTDQERWNLAQKIRIELVKIGAARAEYGSILDQFQSKTNGDINSKWISESDYNALFSNLVSVGEGKFDQTEMGMIQELIYKSLIPFSKLAVNDHFNDRFGGELRPSMLYWMERKSGFWGKAGKVLVGVMTTGVASLVLNAVPGVHLGALHFLPDWLNHKVLELPIWYWGAGFATIGFGPDIINETNELIQSPNDIPNKVKVAISRMGFERRLKAKAKTIAEVESTEPDESVRYIEDEIEGLKLSSRSAKADAEISFGPQSRLSDISQFGSQLQNGTRVLTEFISTISLGQIFDSVENAGAIDKMIKDLSVAATSPETLRGLMTSADFSKFELAVRDLQAQLYKSADAIAYAKAKVAELDSLYSSYNKEIKKAGAAMSSENKKWVDLKAQELLQSQVLNQGLGEAIGNDEINIHRQIEQFQGLTFTIDLIKIRGFNKDSLSALNTNLGSALTSLQATK